MDKKIYDENMRLRERVTELEGVLRWVTEDEGYEYHSTELQDAITAAVEKPIGERFGNLRVTLNAILDHVIYLRAVEAAKNARRELG